MAEPMPGVGHAVTVMISKPLRPSGRSASFAQDVSQHPQDRPPEPDCSLARLSTQGVHSGTPAIRAPSRSVPIVGAGAARSCDRPGIPLLAQVMIAQTDQSEIHARYVKLQHVALR